MTQTDLSTSAFWKDSLKTTNNVITVIAKSTCNIQNIKMISRQSRDLIIRLDISRATVFCAVWNVMFRESRIRQLNLFWVKWFIAIMNHLTFFGGNSVSSGTTWSSSRTKALFGSHDKARNIGFRKRDNHIVTYEQSKLGLSAYYDKRIVHEDGIHTSCL